MPTVFGALPKIPRRQPWTPRAVIQFLADGAPGLDGWQGEHIRALDSVSMWCLCQLLNQADAGHLPRFWREARLVAIPKPESIDRRPLTVMSIFYRTWARRGARRLSEWSSRWMPPGLFGARRGRSAADAIWDLALQLESSRANRHNHSVVVVLDEEKFYDRLLLGTLRALGEQLGLDVGDMATLDNYHRLRRHLWLDGGPTIWSLEGTDLCGIPQGCPYWALLGQHDWCCVGDSGFRRCAGVISAELPGRPLVIWYTASGL